MSVRKHAVALIATCNTVLEGPSAHTVPDPMITALAVRILEAAKAVAPNDEILNSIEIEKGWPALLSAMHAIYQALPCK